MPTFAATDRDGVIDFIAKSFEEDPRLSFDNSEGDSFSCLYRGPEGQACAFGRCVTDEELDFAYDNGEDVEGICASSLIDLLPPETRRTFEAIGATAEPRARSWWDDLQLIHDAVARLYDSDDFHREEEAPSEDLPAMFRKWRDIDYPVLLEDMAVFSLLGEAS